MPKEADLAPGRASGVLVADDDVAVRDVTAEGLRRKGFVVWSAADGRETVNLYRGHYETIDVALLDVCMPGLDGPQTLAALREITPRISCCFMTGHSGSYSEQRLRHLGAHAVFMKPFRLSEVVQVLRSIASPRPGLQEAGTLCHRCGCHRTGNVFGMCPECGTPAWTQRMAR